LHSHAVSLYQPLIHVPLILIYPRQTPRGERIARPVGLLDVPASLADLAGAARRGLPGRSLERCWRESQLAETVDEPLIAELSQVPLPNLPNSDSPIHSLVVGNWHYLHYPGRQPPANSDELFDLAADPDEQHELSRDPLLADTVVELRAQLTAGLGGREDSKQRLGRASEHPWPSTSWLSWYAGGCPCGCRPSETRNLRRWPATRFDTTADRH
jgi:arylsulfatase A-like enzyme